MVIVKRHALVIEFKAVSLVFVILANETWVPFKQVRDNKKIKVLLSCS